MKKYAVSTINFFDNELITEIVSAQDWQHALLNHSKCPFVSVEELETFATIRDAKQEAFNRDGMFDVLEIS